MAINQKPQRGSSEKPDHIMVSFCGDPHTQMAVTWRTDIGVQTGYAEYWAADGVKLRCEAENSPFISDIDESCMHWAQLKGLKPGTRYTYTCGDDQNRSEPFSFCTEEENCEKFAFIALSDFQKGEPHDLPDYSYLNTFVKKILKEHPEVRFILSAGDSTDCGQHEVQWNGMFEGLKGIVESVPYMMALGNHDNRGFKDYDKGIGRYYAEPAEFFNSQFRGAYPFNGPDPWQTETYSFDYGDAHFVIFSINGPEDVNRWAIEDMSNTDRIWKLGTYHFPIYYSGTDCENDDAYPHMRQSMEMCDVMFSGHEHNFSRSFPIRNEELFDRPSRGTVHYMLGNSNANPPGSRTVSKVWHAAFYPQEEPVSAFALVEVEGQKLTLTEILDDGRIVDRCVVDKAADTITPFAVAPRFNRPRMMYKGMDLGLMQVDVYPVKQQGEWYIAAATLIAFIGGEVSRDPGSMTLGLYGHTVTFTEGSQTARTEKGDYALRGKVLRGLREQLYVPAADAAALFGMKWCVSERNNFLSFEHESEQHPVPVQP